MFLGQPHTHHVNAGAAASLHLILARTGDEAEHPFQVYQQKMYIPIQQQDLERETEAVDPHPKSSTSRRGPGTRQ